MRYRNKVTGEIIDTPIPVVATVHEFLINYFRDGNAAIWKDSEAQYELIEEDE